MTNWDANDSRRKGKPIKSGKTDGERESR